MATRKKPAAQKRAVPARRKPGPPPIAQDKLTATGTEGICELIVSGKTYREIAAQHKVSVATLANWIEANPERSHACARAREASGQAFDEQALDAINKARNAFELAKAREAAVHLRWRAKAVNPRRYGEKMALGGAEDLPPIQSVHDLSEQALLAIASGKAA